MEEPYALTKETMHNSQRTQKDIMKDNMNMNGSKVSASVPTTVSSDDNSPNVPRMVVTSMGSSAAEGDGRVVGDKSPTIGQANTSGQESSPRDNKLESAESFDKSTVATVGQIDQPIQANSNTIKIDEPTGTTPVDRSRDGVEKVNKETANPHIPVDDVVLSRSDVASCRDDAVADSTLIGESSENGQKMQMAMASTDKSESQTNLKGSEKPASECVKIEVEARSTVDDQFRDQNKSETEAVVTENENSVIRSSVPTTKGTPSLGSLLTEKVLLVDLGDAGNISCKFPKKEPLDSGMVDFRSPMHTTLEASAVKIPNNECYLTHSSGILHDQLLGPPAHKVKQVEEQGASSAVTSVEVAIGSVSEVRPKPLPLQPVIATRTVAVRRSITLASVGPGFKNGVQAILSDNKGIENEAQKNRIGEGIEFGERDTRQQVASASLSVDSRKDASSGSTSIPIVPEHAKRQRTSPELAVSDEAKLPNYGDIGDGHVALFEESSDIEEPRIKISGGVLDEVRQVVEDYKQATAKTIEAHAKTIEAVKRVERARAQVLLNLRQPPIPATDDIPMDELLKSVETFMNKLKTGRESAPVLKQRLKDALAELQDCSMELTKYAIQRASAESLIENIRNELVNDLPVPWSPNPSMKNRSKGDEEIIQHKAASKLMTSSKSDLSPASSTRKVDQSPTHVTSVGNDQKLNPFHKISQRDIDKFVSRNKSAIRTILHELHRRTGKDVMRCTQTARGTWQVPQNSGLPIGIQGNHAIKQGFHLRLKSTSLGKSCLGSTAKTEFEDPRDAAEALVQIASLYQRWEQTQVEDEEPSESSGEDEGIDDDEGSDDEDDDAMSEN